MNKINAKHKRIATLIKEIIVLHLQIVIGSNLAESSTILHILLQRRTVWQKIRYLSMQDGGN